MLSLISNVLNRRLDAASRLLLGQLVMFTGIAAVFPIAPLYVRSHGGGSVAVALFIAGPMVANTVVQVPAGHLVDKIGRKPVLIGSRLVFVVFSLGLFLNFGPLWLLALYRCGQGLTSGAYVPALRAALSDLSDEDRRGETYAKLQAVEMVGLLIGPAIGGAVALWTFSAVFLCSGLGTLIGVTALFRMPETRQPVEDHVDRAAPGWWREKSVIIPCIGLLAAGIMFSTYDVVWPLYLTARHIGPFVIGLSISIFALPILLLAQQAGRYSDRSNRRLLVAGAFAVVALAASIYPELRSLPIILGVGTVEALAFMLIEPSLFALMSECTSPDVRGRAMGVGGFFQFGGAAFGAGVLGSMYGIAEGLPFWCGAGCCLVAATVLLIGLPRQKPKSTEQPEVLQLYTAEVERT